MAKSSGAGCGGCGGLVLIGVVLVVGISYFGRQATTPREKARQDSPSLGPSVRVAFDVPSLVGKSIDEIRSVLGQPSDKAPSRPNSNRVLG